MLLKVEKLVKMYKIPILGGQRKNQIISWGLIFRDVLLLGIMSASHITLSER